MRPLQCLLGRHTWTDWRKHEKGCSDHGCDHYLRHCTRCPRWQHKFPGGRPRKFKWGGLFLEEFRLSKEEQIKPLPARGGVAYNPMPRPLSEHCRPGRCLALTCCSYECSQGRCPSIPEEFRKTTP